jgi:hypothetical protein
MKFCEPKLDLKRGPETFMPHNLVPLLALLCLFILVGACYAQSPNATVTGLVADTSGSAVPDASVDINDVSTGILTTGKTNAEGLYRIRGLVPGVYRIQVTRSGFKSAIKEGIVLHIQDQVALDFTLQVGEVNQSVTVSGGAPLLQTQTSSLSEVIEGRTVQDTPLNGRNVMNLVTLVPGVVAQGGTQGNTINTNTNGWGNYQIGGGMANQSATYVDGAPVNTSYVNSVSLVPSQDTVREFVVVTNNIPPEYGRFAGGIINMSSKSGTNQFHGTAYEYIRNKVFNANNFFNDRTGLPRPAFTQNQYGVTVGGPIKKDKVFAFFGWEGFGLRTATPEILTVPTAAERNGDFTGVGTNIYDPYTSEQAAPYTRKQFMGCNGNQPNVICGDRIDPTAKVLQNLLPPPNLPGVANNFSVSPSTGGNYNQYLGRVDYALSDKQKLFGRYSLWQVHKLAANPYNNTTGSTNAITSTQQLALGDDYALNNTTAASVRLSYLRYSQIQVPRSVGTDLSTYGPNYAALASQIQVDANPVVSISGFSTQTGQSLFSNGVDNNFTLSGSIIKSLGRHSLNFGGEIRKIEWYYTQNNYPTGYFTFDQTFTAQNPLSPTGSGYSFASFVLGTATSGLLNNVSRPDALQWYGGVYANDSFQFNNRLTLNLGLRWEQPGAFSERRNRLNVVLPNAPDPLSASTGLDLKGQVALVNTPLYPHPTQVLLHWNLFSPRVGFAYRVTDRVVVRAGYGISYLPNDVSFSLAPYKSPVNTASTNMANSLDGNITPDATLSNPFPSGLLQPIGNDAARLGELEGTSPAAASPVQSYAYAQQWNLGMQQQLGNNTAFQIAYGGAKGTHLPLFLYDLDQLPTQYNSMGSALLTPVTNPFYGKLPATSTLGTSKTIPAGQLLRPYPQFVQLQASGSNLAASSYNSLQATLKHQFGAEGNVMVSYTWSKLISNIDTLTSWLETSAPGASGSPISTTTQNTYDLHSDFSVSAFDVPQHLVLSYVVDAPVGQGKALLGQLRGVPQAVLGGWSLNGVTTFQSGWPLTFLAQPTTLANEFGAGQPRPNVAVGCAKQVTGSAQARVGHWFNTGCFSAPSNFGFGNETRNDNQLRSAGIANWDFGLFKTIPIKERFNLEFHAETFNLANRVQFSPPGTTLGTGQFGVVTAQLNQPRLYQFSLRANF